MLQGCIDYWEVYWLLDERSAHAFFDKLVKYILLLVNFLLVLVQNNKRLIINGVGLIHIGHVVVNFL